MFRIDDTTAASSLPAPEAAGTEGYFTEGNPTAGTPATNVRGSWLNMIQEELRAVVVAGGLTPNKTAYTQVRDAIKRIVQNTVVLADTGAVNAYAAANATPLVSGTWVDGVVQAIKIAHTNTGASTYAPDGLAAIPIYGLGLQPLQGGELLLNGTAILMHATIAGVNSGNPICVLMECAGGAQQVTAATKSGHAVNLGQFQTITAFLANQSGTLGNPITATTYSVSTQAITFPAFSKTGAFRVMAQLIASGFSQAAGVEAQFQNTLYDGSVVVGGGNAWSVYKKNSGYGWSVADTFISGPTYAPGATVTFTQRVVAGLIEDNQFSLQNCFMRLWVIEA